MGKQRKGILSAQANCKMQKAGKRDNNSETKQLHKTILHIKSFRQWQSISRFTAATSQRSRRGSSTHLTPLTVGKRGTTQCHVETGPRAKSQQRIKRPDTSYQCHTAWKNKQSINKIEIGWLPLAPVAQQVPPAPG